MQRFTNGEKKENQYSPFQEKSESERERQQSARYQSLDISTARKKAANRRYRRKWPAGRILARSI
jgi:hypothetical protein